MFSALRCCGRAGTLQLAVMEALHFCLLQLNNNTAIRRSDFQLWSMLMGCDRAGLKERAVLDLLIDAVRDYRLVVARKPYDLEDYGIEHSDLRHWRRAAGDIRERRQQNAEVQATAICSENVDRAMHALLLSRLKLSCLSNAWIAAGQAQLAEVQQYVEQG